MNTDQNIIKTKARELYELLGKVFSARERNLRIPSETDVRRLLSTADDLMTNRRPLPFMENAAKKVPAKYNVLAELTGTGTRWSWSTEAYGGQLHLVFVRTDAKEGN